MSESDWKMADRRKHPRIACDFDIRYRLNDQPDVRVRLDEHEKPASMVNISQGGLAFVTDSPLCEGEELTIKFNFEAAGQSRSISVVGRVCYCIGLADQQSCRVGIEFIGLKDADQEAIAGLIREISGKGSWPSRFLK